MRLTQLLLLALLAAASVPIDLAHADPLVLNEILAGPASDWDGSGAFSSRDDEWVEVMNTSGAPLDLSPYVITDGDSLPRYGLSGTLAPGAVLLVTGKMSFDWEHATGNPAFGLSLGNSGDQVILWKVTGSDTVVVDAYAYKSHEAAADRAIGRIPNGGGVWTLFDQMNPYTGTLLPGTTGCAPTPGAPNLCGGGTPTRTVTWGEVKTLYRDEGRR